MTENSNLYNRIKEARIEKHMTYQDIYDALEQQGTPLSMSTIKNFFREGSNQKTFSSHTIAALSGLLLDEFDSCPLAAESEKFECLAEGELDLLLFFAKLVSKLLDLESR